MKYLIICFDNLKKILNSRKKNSMKYSIKIFNFMKTIDRNIDNLMKNLGVTNEQILSQNLA